MAHDPAGKPARQPEQSTKPEQGVQLWSFPRKAEAAPERISPGDALPPTLGAWNRGSLLACTNLSIVYQADHRGGLRGPTVLKILRDPIAGERSAPLEPRLLDSLKHPRIVQVRDAGIEDWMGRRLAWFAMERLPDPRPLTRQGQGPRAGARLLLQACEGLGHAHRKGIVHRDIKPSNILAYRSEGGHAAKVIDFGLAQSVLPVFRDRPDGGGFEGTFAYAAPEQFRRGEVGCAADVWALGAVLCEILTGELPYVLPERGLSPWDEWLERCATHAETAPIVRFPSRVDPALEDLVCAALRRRGEPPRDAVEFARRLRAALRGGPLWERGARIAAAACAGWAVGMLAGPWAGNLPLPIDPAAPSGEEPTLAGLFTWAMLTQMPEDRPDLGDVRVLAWFPGADEQLRKAGISDADASNPATFRPALDLLVDQLDLEENARVRPKAVAIDLFYLDPGTKEQDSRLARAISRVQAMGVPVILARPDWENGAALPPPGDRLESRIPAGTTVQAGKWAGPWAEEALIPPNGPTRLGLAYEAAVWAHANGGIPVVEGDPQTGRLAVSSMERTPEGTPGAKNTADKIVVKPSFVEHNLPADLAHGIPAATSAVSRYIRLPSAKAMRGCTRDLGKLLADNRHQDLWEAMNGRIVIIADLRDGADHVNIAGHGMFPRPYLHAAVAADVLREPIGEWAGLEAVPLFAGGAAFAARAHRRRRLRRPRWSDLGASMPGTLWAAFLLLVLPVAVAASSIASFLATEVVWVPVQSIAAVWAAIAAASVVRRTRLPPRGRP